MKFIMRELFFTVCVLLAATVLVVSGQLNKQPLPVPMPEDVAVREAETLLKNNKFDEATKLLQAELTKKPDDAGLNFWLGKAFYLQGKYPNALEKITLSVGKLPKNNPEYKDAVRMLGLGHYVLGHLATAIPYLELLAGWTPENSEIAYALGVAYVQTRNGAKSREAFARLFNVPTNSAAAYLLNAQMMVKQQFEETAETEAKKALELNLKLPQANFILGELAIYRADIPAGIEYLQKEIQLNPAFAMAHYRLGEALTRQLKWDEAVSPLQKSIWLNPFFSGPYIVLGKVYFKKNDFGNAETILRRAAAIDPKNFSAHYLLAQTLQQVGKADEAKIEFAAAEQLRASGDKEPQE